MASYFRDVIWPLVEQNADCIILNTDGRQASFPDEQIAANSKLLTDFVGEQDKNKKGNRVFGDAFLRLIDDFLQLKCPGFDAAFNNILSVDLLGQTLGTFLRDEASLNDRMRQALNVKKVAGIYSYEDVNTHLEESGDQRVIVFLQGESLDYLRVVDFIFDVNEEKLHQNGRNINLVSGFCIPGEEFTPVITRSAIYRARHLGLLYTRGNLVEMSGGPLDDLTYESFTTNKSQLGSAAKTDGSSHSHLFAQALDIHYGPRLRRDLTPVLNPIAKAKITKIVEKIAMDML